MKVDEDIFSLHSARPFHSRRRVLSAQTGRGIGGALCSIYGEHGDGTIAAEPNLDMVANVKPAIRAS